MYQASYIHLHSTSLASYLIRVLPNHKIKIIMKRIIPIIALLTLTVSAYAQSVLSVEGNASMAVKPTTTTINLNIESKHTSYPGAVQSMIERVDQLTKDLKKLGFEDKDIVTSNFNVNQSRIYVRNQWKDSGFVATQNLIVSFDQDKKKLLEVLNTATKSSSRPSISLSFGLDASKKESVKNELIKLAVSDAKTKADIIAAASGYQITGIKEIRYGELNRSPLPMYEAAASRSFMKTADVEIANFEASDLRFNESISIVYTIDK